MIRDTAERARELLARTIHRKNDLCRRDGAEESWDSGYECACFEIADAILKSEWLTQIQAEARERLSAWMTERSFSTGHGDTFEDLLKELDWQVKELRGRARLEEAKWWHTQVALAYMCDEQEMRSITRARIAALAQALQPEEKEE